MSNHLSVTDLMAEADSYHRFWIEERGKRIALEKALEEIAGTRGIPSSIPISVARAALAALQAKPAAKTEVQA